MLFSTDRMRGCTDSKMAYRFSSGPTEIECISYSLPRLMMLSATCPIFSLKGPLVAEDMNLNSPIFWVSFYCHRLHRKVPERLLLSTAIQITFFVF